MHHLLHHANCADGFAAACIARHALLSQGIPETDINVQPVNYGWPQQIPASFAPGDDVTYLDYTPAQVDIDHLLFLNAALTIIDHHSTAAIRHGLDKDTGLPLEAFTEGETAMGMDSIVVLWWLARRMNGEALLPYFDDPCPMCGERYACGYDAEGRPLVHVAIVDDEGRSNL